MRRKNVSQSPGRHTTSRPSITEGTRTISFQDDFNHQRFRQATPEGTTLYLDAFGTRAELVIGATSNRWNEYLTVGNQLVGVRFVDVAAQTVSTRYFHTDNLGSVWAITNETGGIVRELSYDPWGKRRFLDGNDDPTNSLASETTRGFTGEEELSVGGLVHLNGRVYDPLIARMISADPVVPNAMDQQTWNRYSYVGNDPLAFTDPSGHGFLSEFFGAILSFFKPLLQNPIVRAVVQIALSVILSPLGPIGAAIAAATVTGLSGGKLGDILKAGAIAGITAGAFWISGEIGSVLPGANPGLLGQHGIPDFGSAAHVFSIASHAGIGCASAVASGGQCGQGALSGGVSAAASPVTPNNVVAHAAVGGLASVAGGGKFENGAVTAAFGYLFNQEGPRSKENANCAFFCSVLGGPVDIKDAYGNVIGVYNRQMFGASMQAAGATAAALDVTLGAAIGGMVLVEGAAIGVPYLGAALGPSGSIFGRQMLGGSSILNINANANLRVGWGWMGTQAQGTNVFRISGNWVDSVMGARNSHVNIFTWSPK